MPCCVNPGSGAPASFDRGLNALMQFSCIAPDQRRFLDAARLALYLRRCAVASNDTPVYDLSVPADLERLPDAIQ